MVLENADIEAIKSRINHLDALHNGTKYAKQKCQLQSQFESFLAGLTPQKSIYDCTSQDVRYFLAWKDANGRTVVHNLGCPFRGSQGKHRCTCPSYMAAGTVDSLIGKLRAILRDVGRGTEWNEALGCGNPAAAPSVKQHLKTVKREQAQAMVLPRQATPLLLDKVIMLSRFLLYKLRAKDIDKATRYLLWRDRTYFILICQLGDRAGDLGLLQTNHVKLHQDKLSVVETAGKCLPNKKRSTKRVVLLQMSDKLVCPVEVTKRYFEEAPSCGVDLQGGYLFRTLDAHNKVSDNHVTSGTMSARLKKHLEDMGAWNRETSHSARVGCSITLALLGVAEADIMAHIGWDSTSMVQHYTKAAAAVRQNRAAVALAQAVDKKPDSISRIEEVSRQLREAENC